MIVTVVRWVATALVVAGTIAWTLSEWYLGLAGALVGLLLELTAPQAGLALGAVLFGLRVDHVIIGVGGELRSWTTANRRIVLRNIPVLASIGISGRKPGVRRRTVLTGAFAIVLCAAIMAATWLATGSAFGKGLALAATACFLVQLVPVEKAAYTSLGWFVFSLPKLAGRPLEELEARPRVGAGMDAYYRGDLDEAERICAQLATDHPDLLSVVGLKVMTTCARAKYLEALQAVVGLTGRSDLAPRELSLVMATTAGVAAFAVEAGQFPAEVGPGARVAVVFVSGGTSGPAPRAPVADSATWRGVVTSVALPPSEQVTVVSVQLAEAAAGQVAAVPVGQLSLVLVAGGGR